MKKLILLFHFVVFLNISQAQVIMGNFGGGYNASFVKAETVNQIIGRYNDTRSYITDPMDELHFMDGISWNFHFIYDAVMFDFNFNKRKAESMAIGNPGTGMMQRDLKFKANTFSIGMGLNVLQESPWVTIMLPKIRTI